MNIQNKPLIEGFNKSLEEQLEIFKDILRLNSKLINVLEILEKYALENPDFSDYYVGAGCINQTIFNYYHEYEIDYGIKDFDIVYFDKDTSYDKEDIIIKELSKRLDSNLFLCDIKNEARVHIWYKEKYGIERKPYLDVRDAIASWGATVTCVGVRLREGKLEVFAPYGLNDIFGMIIRPVKREFTKEAYMERANRWKMKWNKLEIMEWN